MRVPVGRRAARQRAPPSGIVAPGIASSRRRVYSSTRTREDLVDRALLDDPAALHDAHEVGHHAHDREVVGDEQVGQAELGLQVGQQLQDLVLHQHVERRDRLVEHDDVGLERERARDRDALTLSAGELTRIAGAQLLRQRDLIEQFDSRAPRVDALSPDLVDLERLGDGVLEVAQRVERAVRVLEHRLHAAADVEGLPA